MKYMLLIYNNVTTWDTQSDDEFAEVMRRHQELIGELTERGELVGTNGLTTIGAKVVRERDAALAVTDGPFGESKEVLAGYYLIDCTEDRAVEVAGRLPEAATSLIDVRRVME